MIQQQPTFHHNFNLFFDGFHLRRSGKAESEQLLVSRPIGEGQIRRLIPRADMEVVVSDYRLHRSHAVYLATTTPMVELSFCLQGSRTVNIDGRWYEFVPGSCGLQLLARTDARFEFRSSDPLRMVGIGIPVDTFHCLMERVDGIRTVDFAQLLQNRDYRMFQGGIDAASLLQVNQLLQLIEAGVCRNIELESATLELLTRACRAYLPEQAGFGGQMPADDLEKLQTAKHILLERMDDPPSLLELSRLIGLNDFKLKNGFKLMFGTTVFGYLREQRLEKAYRLLQHGMNVSEASCAVGYSNSSYFSEAFREKFGVNPGQLAKKRGIRANEARPNLEAR